MSNMDRFSDDEIVEFVEVWTSAFMERAEQGKWDKAEALLENIYGRLRYMVDEDMIAEKKKTYGDNFPDIAFIWTEFLVSWYHHEVALDSRMVSMMMALMKVSRLINNPGHRDSLVDLLNYLHITYSYKVYEEY